MNSIKRFSQNPLITPKDVTPTQNDFEVLSVLNPAVTRLGDEIILLMRVAQRPRQQKGFISVGTLDVDTGGHGYRTLHFNRDDPLLDAHDPRVVAYDQTTYLTSISHLHIARSKDGVRFAVDPYPFIYPSGVEEEYGCEDARITFIDGVHYIYYVAVARYGYSTVLVSTTDFRTYRRLGNIMPGVNKDVAIFPEKINGLYYALTRPDTNPFAKPSIWISASPDLVYWGQHKHLFGTRKGLWDSARIGAGTVPLKTPQGWLEIYHGADANHRYCLGVTMLDLNDPSNVLFRGYSPILEPQESYETNGFFSNVVFTNGAALADDGKDTLYLYYGAADQQICGVQCSIENLLKLCR